MNTKWYIGTLITLLAFIGLNQEQTKVANQQIVLQFSDVEKTSIATRNDALAIVVKKLEAFGISKIEIVEEDDSQLSIHYYSDIEAHSVSKFFSLDDELSLAYRDIDQRPFDFPKDQLPDTFSIVVSDLHQQPDGLGLNGKLAFELNQDYQRFSNPVVLLLNIVVVFEQDAIDEVAYKINKVVVITIDNSSNAIPEVRAGPIT